MRTFLFLVLTLPVLAGDLFVFSRDGLNGTCAPRDLPSVGQRLADPSSVVILHAASDYDRAACGWYRFVPHASEAAPAGQRLASRMFVIEDGAAVEKRTYVAVSGNIELSKYKLLIGIEQLGALDAFVTYLNADAKRKLLWDAAVTLDSTNSLVVAAVDALGAAYGYSTITNLMINSRVRK